MRYFLPADLGYGLRRLARRPALTALMVVTLGIGVAASTTAFGFVEGVLLRPLKAYSRTNRIVVSRSPVLAGDFRNIAAKDSALERAELYSPHYLYLDSGCGSRGLVVTSVSSGFFSLLRVSPALGRSFLKAEYAPGHDREVVLSQGLWLDCFGGKHSVIGKEIKLGGKSYTVVGVMPAWFQYHEPAYWPAADLVEAWTPLALNKVQLGERGTVRYTASGRLAANGYYTYIIARLRAGVGLRRANAQTHAITLALATEHQADQYLVHNLKLVKPLDWLAGTSRAYLWLFFAASCMPLLMSCLNVACLVLADGASRSREMAIRMSLGAGPASLLSLAEGLAIGLGGTLLGLVFSFGGIHLFVALAPAGKVPRLGGVRIDAQTLGFALLAAVASALAWSVLVAARYGRSRLALGETLGTRAGTTPSPGNLRAQTVFTLAQVAMATVLLVVAALVVKSLQALRETNLGLNPNNVLTSVISPAATMQASSPPHKYGPQLRSILEEVEGIQGVSSAGLTTAVYPGVSGVRFMTGNSDPNQGQAGSFAWWQRVTNGYFQALRIPLLRGRMFSVQAAHARGAGEAIVSRTLAREYFPNQDPLGQTLLLRIPWVAGETKARQLRVVGVVGDVKMDGPQRMVMPEIYTSTFWLAPIGSYLIVRTQIPPRTLKGDLRRIVAAAGPSLVATPPVTMDRRVQRASASERFLAAIMAIFGCLAIALALVGEYGLFSQTTRIRAREIGLRRALGAQDGQILRWAMRKAAVLLLCGISAGAIASLGLAQILRAWLYNAGPADASVYVLAGIVLLSGGLLAAYFPIKRALAIRPADALRHE